MSLRWLTWTVVVAGFLVFAILAHEVRVSASAVWRFDRGVAEALKEHADGHPQFVSFAHHATEAGSIPVMTALALVGSLLLWLCGHTRLAVCWLLAAALGSAIDVACKSYFSRARPDATLRDAAVTERNPSYPSGHSMGSVIGYGALAYVCAVLLKRRSAKVFMVAVLMALVLAIGWSRVYLRAHWFSDVMGGYAIGLSWLGLCIALLESRARPLEAS